MVEAEEEEEEAVVVVVAVATTEDMEAVVRIVPTAAGAGEETMEIGMAAGAAAAVVVDTEMGEMTEVLHFLDDDFHLSSAQLVVLPIS